MRSLRTEFLKLLTTRTTYLIALGAVGVGLLAVFSTTGQSVTEWSKPLHEQQFFFLRTFSKLFLVALGARAVTDEYRYGTIVPTVLATPNRFKHVLSKTAAVGAVSALVAAVAEVVTIAAGVYVIGSKGIDVSFASTDILAIGGGVVAGALWGVIGVAIGYLVRHPVLSTVAPIVWLLTLEEAVRHQIGAVGDHLPGQAGMQLAIAPNGYAFLEGALTLTAIAVVALGAGAFLIQRRDIA